MAQWYIGGLILCQHKHFILTGDLGSALDDDPVLSAMMMHLQRQSLPRVDDNTLHLKTL